MGRKVVVAGHICIDITPVFPEHRVEHMEEILAPGKLIQVGKADIHTGGVVANTGLCMHKLGADVNLMGKVGNDEFGRMILGILKEHGMESGMILSDDCTTSYSIVLAVPGIDRIFLHNPGANDDFYFRDIRMGLVGEADLFHFGYPPLMASMYERDGEELVSIFREVDRLGVLTSLDMAAVDENSKSGAADWERILGRVLPFVDFFFPSVEELAYMIDRDKYRELKERAGGKDMTEVLSIEEDVRPLADKLIRMGTRAAVIKCGVTGLYYKIADSAKMQILKEKSGIDFSDWAGKEGLERSYTPEKVLSGTGAGDTTIGAFLCALLEERSIEQCLQLATGTGASCVESYDALSGLRSFEQLEEKIKNGWKKQ